MEMIKCDALGSVAMQEKSGLGLPYAPENWPNPGDVWTWKLGKRIGSGGFYRDRCLVLPPRLHQKGKRKYFDSKKSIIDYLRSEFPETNVDAFFQSFTWKVPASFNISHEKVDKRGALSSDKIQSQAEVTPRPRKVRPRSKSEKIRETLLTRRLWRLDMSKASSKKSVRFSPKEVKDITDLSSRSNGIRSCELTDAGPRNDQSATSQEKMFKARIKLLLLLASDIPVMPSSIKLSEIMHLWAYLKTDPNIDAARYGIQKLKVIDVFPLAWKQFQESLKISEVADKLSQDLKSNIAWATELENEYNESKGNEYILHKEIDSISLDIEKIDEQISALQSRRDELASAADVKKKAVDMLISKQKNAAECLSNVVHEVEMGKKRRQEWELKKKMSEEQMAKILSKFDPLRNFCLQKF